MSRTVEDFDVDTLPKTIFKFGSIAALLSAVSIAFAIVAYFIWPYKGNTSSIEEIRLNRNSGWGIEILLSKYK